MTIAVRLALRELAGGLRGFWIYIACLALGTAAIAAAGSVTEVFSRGLAAEARTLLGGDLMLVTRQRELSQDERRFFDTLGSATDTAGLDLMGTAGELRRQVDVRAVDNAFPLLGDVVLTGHDGALAEALVFRNDRWGAVVTQSFLEAFSVDIGDTVDIGPIRAQVRARVDKLPDRFGTPGGFGPEAIVHIDAMRTVGRLDNGQIFQGARRIVLDGGHSLQSVSETFEEAFPNSSVRLRGPEDAIDGLQSVLEILNTFMTIIGVAALVAGGLGVSQAATAFLATRTGSMAALKALGASSGTLRSAYLIQFAALALLGAVVGLAVGAATPFALAIFADVPLPLALGVYWVPLAKALALGLLAALVFAVPVLGRARATPPAALFRSIEPTDRSRTPWPERCAALAAIGLLLIVAVAGSQAPIVTIMLLGGTIVAWALLALVAQGVQALARLLGRQARGYWRLSMSNLGGAGSLAPTILPAMGLGLGLLCLVVAVQANVLRQLRDTAPTEFPSLIFNQIPSDQTVVFDQVLKDQGVDIENRDMYQRAPFLLVRLVAIDGVAFNADTAPPQASWLARRETRVTYLAERPDETELLAGEWWPGDYRGPLRVSLRQSIARAIGVEVGSELSFQIFGRTVTATVGSIRTTQSAGFGIGANTGFIFSPGELELARPYHTAIARTSADRETPLINALGQAVPEVVVFQVRPAIENATAILADVSIMVNAASGVVILAGLLVLFGTFAAMSRSRRAEAALLKTFGATRQEILGLYAIEFALAGAVAAVLGAGIGIAAAYPVVVYQVEADWHWPLMQVGSITMVAAAIVGLGGLGVGIATLSRPPAETLRTE